MSVAAFFGALSVVVLVALAVEAWVGRGRGWYSAADTLANLNLGVGNLILGASMAALILGAYTWVWEHRWVSASARLPGWAYWGLGFLLAELCQYWNHRLSHTWNLLSWGHLTHHTSSRLNLSTAPRVNWLYRGYAWLFYLPLPLLGYPAEAFLVFQAVMNVHNAFCHTRFTLPLGPGPLRFLFVTPMAHRLHHSRDPKHFGNFGAALLVWDHVFGTYRALAPDEDPEALRYGVEARMETADPLTLNLHGLGDIWRAGGRTVGGAIHRLLSTEPAPMRSIEGAGEPAGWRWGAAIGALLVAAAVAQLSVGWVPWPAHAALVAMALAASVALGRRIDRARFSA